MRSGLVLIDRGLNHKQKRMMKKVSGFGRSIPTTESSANGGEVTPVPIPNTEVKLSSADGSATAREQDGAGLGNNKRLNSSVG